VPLECDLTTPLAYALNQKELRELDSSTAGLLNPAQAEKLRGLYMLEPYQPGKIPVLMIHGLWSSPITWMEMFNDLRGAPEIRSRYQFWFFQYDSGAPIALSSLRLREALGKAVAQIDPEGKDPALRRMVLIGHSQGGLLVKMQSIETGDRLWNAVSRKPLDQLELSDETRDLFRRGFFLEPVPEVSRVVFISTPHRGSFIAASRVIANLTRWVASLPVQLVSVSADFARNRDAARAGVVPTAVDNMSPEHPFIKGLQDIPVAASIPAHSIISVEGTGPVEQGDDGVVAYSSAHIDGVESELVVRSPHSCQANPHTIEEVRRILRLHAGLPTDAAPLEVR
jgi:pimeloyl-ACP methyl ester carboxylesterase